MALDRLSQITSSGISTTISFRSSGINVTGIITATSIVVSAGTTALPSISPSGDSNTGVFFPSADTIAASTGGTSRITIDSSGNITVTNNLIIPLGTSLLPSLAFLSDPNTGIYSPGADTLALVTAGTNRLHITSAGLVGIGTTAPDANSRLHVSASENTSDPFATDASIVISNYQAAGNNEAASLKFLLGTTPGTNAGSISCHYDSFSAGVNSSLRFYTVYQSAFNSPAERMRIDPQGRVGIGTTSPSQTLHVNGTARFDVATSNTVALSIPKGFINGDSAGSVGPFTIGNFGDSSSEMRVATRGMTTFFTGATDSATGTERARIDSSGRLLVGTTTDTDSEAGTRIKPGVSGGIYVTNNTSDDGARVLLLNRQGGNGNLVDFRESNTLEGAISVSGTTVTYGGGHLARWSQLPNDQDPSIILKGTVMSNLDEMCEWGEEDNEQLNKTKISDVEGDKNIAGVFVATSSSEDGPLDFFVGMTGDMVIRIAEGITVERGDLLMSAGDGTAKPQDDDIIRSKTIAKVTSTNVSCTYEDGSYCVPCVLMAC